MGRLDEQLGRGLRQLARDAPRAVRLPPLGERRRRHHPLTDAAVGQPLHGRRGDLVARPSRRRDLPQRRRPRRDGPAEARGRDHRDAGRSCLGRGRGLEGCGAWRPLVLVQVVFLGGAGGECRGRVAGPKGGTVGSPKATVVWARKTPIRDFETTPSSRRVARSLNGCMERGTLQGAVAIGEYSNWVHHFSPRAVLVVSRVSISEL